MFRSSKGVTSAVAERARYSCRIRFSDIEAELDTLIERAVAAIVASTPAPDAILGDYVGLASLIRSVSFHEGKLLEQAIIAIGQHNPDLVVLWQSLRLPVTPAALEAIALNRGGRLKGLSFDADAKTRASYTPDLVVVNRRYHSATILDVKRSIASYLDTHRLAELKTRMLAASLILPDWLYKEHKRLMADTVGIAIIDGASGPSDHESGIWAMAEIDDLLEIDGAAEAMAELRRRFGEKIRALLAGEAQRLVEADVEPTRRMQPSCADAGGSLAAASGQPAAVAFATEAHEDDAGPAALFGLKPDGAIPASRTGNNFRSAAPHIPRTIRVGFARARLDA
ncbi:hypothetical protein [Aurantimonas endophytica]|uniref:Uncharacterized protein n=1 Tax=Aurantimonas endophytica TaxID=1522175 RepID=A0A7W6MR07_9HYPH|nr:hypothetical protein [Aurantimonas endophytica]MBB4004590.1 hypothetical protein [Aurantimonas endophytica]MCO6405426.1 hypothetical protein [Aurantimonas endophytica]